MVDCRLQSSPNMDDEVRHPRRSFSSFSFSSASSSSLMPVDRPTSVGGRSIARKTSSTSMMLRLLMLLVLFTVRCSQAASDEAAEMLVGKQTIDGGSSSSISGESSVTSSSSSPAAVSVDNNVDGHLTALTIEDFDDEIGKFDHTLVLFQAAWCRHCQALGPEFAIVRTALKGSDVNVATVDGSTQYELIDKYQVTGFPTIKLFSPFIPYGPITYDGDRIAADIVDWVTRRTKPRVTHVDSFQTLSGIVDVEQLTVLGLTKKGSCRAMTEVLTAVASSIQPDTIKFLASNDPLLFDRLDVNADHTGAAVVVFRKADNTRFHLAVDCVNQSATVDALQSFIERHRLPSPAVFSRATWRLIAGSHVTAHVLLVVDSKSADFRSVFEAFHVTAELYNDQNLLFVVFDAVDPDSRQIIDSLGIGWSTSDLPLIYYVQSTSPGRHHDDSNRPHRNNNYRVQGRQRHVINSADMNDFLLGVLQDRLGAVMSRDWESKSVKVLTSDNFHLAVNNAERHVLVAFYVPWCIHCQRLMPVLDQLGAKYLDSRDVIVAKIDVTENAISDVHVEFFPTIKLYLRDSSEVVDFTDERSVERLGEFIELHRLSANNKEMISSDHVISSSSIDNLSPTGSTADKIEL